MFKDLKNIITDNKMKIIILENKVNVLGYTSIMLIDDDKILLNANDKTIKIIGKDLVITKLLNNELLIVGPVEEIKMGW